MSRAAFAAALLGLSSAAFAAQGPELVTFSAPIDARPSPMTAAAELPSAQMIPLPPAPAFSALDTRELAAAAPARSALSAYLPAPLARLADSAVQWRQAKTARARPSSAEEQSAFESLQKIHAALSSGDKQGAVDELETSFASKPARSWYARNGNFDGYQASAAGYYRYAERALLADRERAVARGRDAAYLAEAERARLNGTLLGRPRRATAAQAKGTSLCAFHALCNAAGGDVGDLVALAQSKLDRVETGVDAHYGARLGIKTRVAVAGGLDARALGEVAGLRGLELSDAGRLESEEKFLAMIGSRRGAVLSLRLFHPKRAIPAEERGARGHDFEALHHAVSLLGAFPSALSGGWLYMVQDSGSGTTDFYTWDELRGQVHRLHPLNLP